MRWSILKEQRTAAHSEAHHACLALTLLPHKAGRTMLAWHSPVADAGERGEDEGAVEH